MMTLDEAIKHAEEVAEQNEWFDKNCLESMQCRECAKEHQQLAEWLKELKQLREKEPKTGYWEYDKDKSNWYDSIYRCSCCGRTVLIPFQSKADVDLYRDYPYCHCGAKMEEEE